MNVMDDKFLHTAPLMIIIILIIILIVVVAVELLLSLCVCLSFDKLCFLMTDDHCPFVQL